MTTAVAMSGTGIQACLDASEQLGGGKFVKLQNDGDKVVGVFIGEPSFVANKIWVNGKVEPFDPAKHKGQTPKPEFKWNFYDIVKKEMFIFQLNNKTFKDLATEKAKKYGIKDVAYEITRKGAKGATDTVYLIAPEMLDGMLRKLTEDEKKHVATLQLHDLLKSGDEDDESTDMNSHKKDGAAKAAPAAAASAATAPAAPALITAEEQNALVSRIKVLPDDKKKQFQTEFLTSKNKAKIGQLDQTEHAQAKAWLTAVEENLKAEREKKAREAAIAAANGAAASAPADVDDIFGA